MTLKFLICIIIELIRVTPWNPRLTAVPRITYRCAQPVVETETPAVPPITSTCAQAVVETETETPATNGESSTQLSQNLILELQKNEEYEKNKVYLSERINQLKKFDYKNFKDVVKKIHYAKAGVDLNKTPKNEEEEVAECENFARAVISYYIYTKDRGTVCIDSGTFDGEPEKLRLLHSDLRKPFGYINSWDKGEKARNGHVKNQLLSLEEIINTGNRLFLKNEREKVEGKEPLLDYPKFPARSGYFRSNSNVLIREVDPSYKIYNVKEEKFGKRVKVKKSAPLFEIRFIPGYPKRQEVPKLTEEAPKSQKRKRGSR